MGDGNDHPSPPPAIRSAGWGSIRNGLGILCRGRGLFTPVAYSGRSANDQTIQGWAAEQEETEDDTFGLLSVYE